MAKKSGKCRTSLMTNRKIRSSVVTIIVVLILLMASVFGWIELSDDMVDHAIDKSTSIVEDVLEIKESVSKNIINDETEDATNGDEKLTNNNDD